jgi:hypothetical protein
VELGAVGNNEVHRNIRPNSRWNRERLECAWTFDGFSLVALTGITFSHKGADFLFHTFLEKIMFDLFIGFGKA